MRWLALAAGLGLLLLVLAPWIARPFVPGIAAKVFAERFAGRLEVGSCELSWFGTQALHGVVLRDPQGAAVAQLDVELPSLWQLAHSGGRRLGRVRATLGATLVADDAGVTNLERALAPRTPTTAEAPPSSSSSPRADEPGALEELALELDLESPLCSWSDARTRAASPSRCGSCARTSRCNPARACTPTCGPRSRARSPASSS